MFIPERNKKLFHGGLVNSQNYCPEVMITMVDYCPRLKDEGNSPLGHPRHRVVMVLAIHQTAMKLLFYYPTITYKLDTMKNKFV